LDLRLALQACLQIVALQNSGTRIVVRVDRHLILIRRNVDDGLLALDRELGIQRLRRCAHLEALLHVAGEALHGDRQSIGAGRNTPH
jgi:hypothetical protein